MGSGLIKTAVERPVGVIVGMLLIVMFGTLSLLQLPIQLTPDIQAPTLTVTTVWPGAAPQEVESEILERQEEYLKSLTGLEEMVSEARTGQGTITMELKVGTSIQEALVRASNLLTQVPQYPLGARQPVLKAANSAGPPLAVILIQANDSGSVEHWRTFTEEEVVPRIERVEGVASIRLVGGQDSVVEVEFDVSALAARGVSLSQLSQAITAELSNLSAGDLDIGKRRFQVRTILTPERFEELESIVIATDDDGTPIWLGDVAEVRVGLRKPSARVLGDGKST
ncbi:MAG: efflux RND transporter permease subunit, partial [Myxococcota bacterium]